MTKKAIRAIDTVPEKIAPSSQAVEKRMLAALEQGKKETQLLGCLTQVLNESPDRKAKIQLLSINCGKDDEFTSKMNLLICLKG